MAQAHIHVHGLSELLTQLRRASSQFPKEMKTIHGKVGEVVADAARQRIRRRSGRLAGTVRVAPTQRHARLRAGRAGLDPRSGYDYSRINHYGRPGWYPGNPFFDDAIQANSQKIISTYMSETEKFLARIAQGAL